MRRVLVKNAKGHALYELGEPMTWEPSWVGISPHSLLSAQQRDEFENLPDDLLWPEIGSRMMQRMASGDLRTGGWVELQENIYRCAVFQRPGELVVKIVLREYLAFEVGWEESSIS